MGSLVPASAKVGRTAACCWMCVLLISWSWKGGVTPPGFMLEEFNSLWLSIRLSDLQATCLCRKYQNQVVLGYQCFLACIGQAPRERCCNRAFPSLVFSLVLSRDKVQGQIPEIAVKAGEHFFQVRCEILDSGGWKMSRWGLIA